MKRKKVHMKNTSWSNLLLHVLVQVKRIKVHYLDDEYICEKAILSAFFIANIYA